LSVAIAIPSLVQSTIVMAFDDDTAVAHFAAPTAVPIAVVMPLDNDGFRFCGRDRWQSKTQHREPRRENNQVAHLIPPLSRGSIRPCRSKCNNCQSVPYASRYWPRSRYDETRVSHAFFYVAAISSLRGARSPRGRHFAERQRRSSQRSRAGSATAGLGQSRFLRAWHQHGRMAFHHIA
jgi:hypothetical protein